jgi:hypothetical protein
MALCKRVFDAVLAHRSSNNFFLKRAAFESVWGERKRERRGFIYDRQIFRSILIELRR